MPLRSNETGFKDHIVARRRLSPFPLNRSSRVNKNTHHLCRLAASSTCSRIVGPPAKSFFQSSTLAPSSVRIAWILLAVPSCLPL